MGVELEAEGGATTLDWAPSSTGLQHGYEEPKSEQFFVLKGTVSS